MNSPRSVMQLNNSMSQMFGKRYRSFSHRPQTWLDAPSFHLSFSIHLRPLHVFESRVGMGVDMGVATGGPMGVDMGVPMAAIVTGLGAKVVAAPGVPDAAAAAAMPVTKIHNSLSLAWRKKNRKPFACSSHIMCIVRFYTVYHSLVPVLCTCLKGCQVFFISVDSTLRIFCSSIVVSFVTA